jgi:hypothetical protein
MFVHHALSRVGRDRSGRYLLTASTVDGMGVRGSSSFVDNGVQTCERSAVVAGHAPESVGRAGQHSCRSDGCDRLHGGEYSRLGLVVEVEVEYSCDKGDC